MILFACLVATVLPIRLLIGGAPTKAITYGSKPSSIRELLLYGIPASTSLMMAAGIAFYTVRFIRECQLRWVVR